MSFDNIPKNLDNTLALIREGFDYDKADADAFPTPTADEVGARLIVTDTGAEWIWTGTNWYQTHVAATPQVRSSDPIVDIIRGLVPGSRYISKFAYKDNATAAGGEETIWEAAGNFTVMKTADTFDITYNNVTDGAAGGATGALSLLITYLDTNKDEQEAIHVLGSTGTDTTSFSGLGISRAVVLSSGTNDTNVNNISFADTSGTVSNQAHIPAGVGVTQTSVLHIPRNVVASMGLQWINVGKVGGTNPEVLVYMYVYSRAVDCVYRISITDNDSSNANTPPPINNHFPLSGQDVVWFTMDTDTNNTILSLKYSVQWHAT